MRYDREAIGDEPQCRQCGRKVDADIARVLGDNDGNLPTCRECRQPNSNNPTASDSRAAAEYWAARAGRRVE